MDTNPKLDEWGEPIEGKKECFHCGSYYYPQQSTAHNDYRTTYCSVECQDKDTLQMKMSAEAEARFTNHESTELEKSGNMDGVAEVKIGDFVLKVKKESN